MNLSNCYRILGLGQDASMDDVYRAYRELSMQWHPRKYELSPRELPAACKRWDDLHQAYYDIGLTVTQNIGASVANRNLPDVRHADSFRENAIKLRELKRFGDSLEMFATAIYCDPSKDANYFELAILFGDMQLSMQAIDAISCALRINPAHDLARFVTGNEYMNLGVTSRVCRREQEAISLFEKAIECYKLDLKINGPNETVYTSLGEAYVEAERFDDAIRAYNEAIRLYEKIATVDSDNLAICSIYRDLGCACLSAERFRDAIVAFQHLVQQDPDRCAHWWFLGVAHSNSGEFRKATQAFKEGIRVESTNVGAHLELARAHLKLNNKLAALEEYKILQTLSPEKADQLFNEIYP